MLKQIDHKNSKEVMAINKLKQAKHRTGDNL